MTIQTVQSIQMRWKNGKWMVMVVKKTMQMQKNDIEKNEKNYTSNITKNETNNRMKK